MNKFKTLAIVLSVVFAVSACQKAANSNTSNTAANSTVNSNAAANTASNTAANAAPAADTTVGAPGSPTEIYKAAHIARQKKDIPTLKKLFAKDVLDFFTEIGKADKKTLDEMLLEMCKEAIPGEPQVRNEKIDGDKATVEYKDADGKWEDMNFVKEGGSWKMTVPKGELDEEKKHAEEDK